MSDRQSQAAEVSGRYTALLAALEQGVLVQDAQLQVIEANAAAEVLFAAAEGMLLGGADPLANAVDEDYRRIEADLTPPARALESGGSLYGQIVGVQPNDGGAVRWFSVNAVPLPGSLPEGEEATNGATDAARVITTLTDVTERKALEVELSHLALHDGLTGLANRTLLLDRIGHAMTRITRRHPDPTVGVSMMFVDIDSFKVINDGLGNRVGDEILRILAQRLQTAVRDEDTVARVGGDEFIVLCDEINRTDLARFCMRVSQIFAQPVICRVGDDWRSVAIGCTAGVAMSRQGEDADRFLQRVDAMLKEQTKSAIAERGVAVTSRAPAPSAGARLPQGERRHRRR